MLMKYGREDMKKRFQGAEENLKIYREWQSLKKSRFNPKKYETMKSILNCDKLIEPNVVKK